MENKPMSERHRLIQLTAENIKRVKAVSFTFKNGVTVIAGRNAQGKTSALDALMFLLMGKRHPDPKILREGEAKGFVEVETDRLLLKRTVTNTGGGTLTVKPKDGGATYAGPQNFLDEITGRVCFDPLAFMRMSDKEQAIRLRELVGLDFTETDAEIQKAYNERTEINRDFKRLAAELYGMEYDASATEKKDPTAVRSKLSAINDLRSEAETSRRKLFDLRRYEENVLKSITDLKAEKAALEARLEEIEVGIDKCKDAHDQTVQDIARAEARYQEQEAAVPDQNELLAELEAIQLHNQNVEQTLRASDKAEQCDATRRISEKLTAKIERLQREKAEALKSAKFPVAGLSFTGEGVTFNGIPLSQASGSEQIRVAVAISAAMNPSLPVMIIKDGSLLDKDSMNLLGQLAEELDLQILMERIERDEFVSVVIEDGTNVEFSDASHAPDDQGTLTLES